MNDSYNLFASESVNPVIRKKVGLFGSTALMSRRFIVGSRAADKLYDGPQFGAQTQGVVPLLYGELLIDGNPIDGGVSQSALDPERLLKSYRILLSDGPTEGLGDDPLKNVYVNCKPIIDGNGKANIGDVILLSAASAAIGQGIPYLLDAIIPKPKAVVTDVDPETGEPIQSLEAKIDTRLATLQDVDFQRLCENHIPFFNQVTGKWNAKHFNDLLKEAGMTVEGTTPGNPGSGGSEVDCCCLPEPGEETEQCSEVERDNTSNNVAPPGSSNSSAGVLLPPQGENKTYRFEVDGENTNGVRIHFLSAGLYKESKFNTNKATANAETQSEGNLTGAFKDGANSGLDQDSRTDGTVTFRWCLFGNDKAIDQGDITISGYSEGYVSRNAEILWSNSKAAACIALSSEDYFKAGEKLELRVERMNMDSSCDAYFQGYDLIPGNGWKNTLVNAAPPSSATTPDSNRTAIQDDGLDPQIKASGGTPTNEKCPVVVNNKEECCEAKNNGDSPTTPGGETPSANVELNIPDAPPCDQAVVNPQPPVDGNGQTPDEANQETGEPIKTEKRSFGEGLKDLLGGIAGATLGGVLTQFFMPRTSTTNITLPADQVGDEARLAFLYKGVIVKVPNNFNGTERTYTGEWDGVTFKEEWTNDPAWCALDYITNKRYGAGDDIRLSEDYLPDFYQQLYRASIRNSERVPNGIGGFEPRYSLNAYFVGSESKWEAIQSIASNMNAQFIWQGSDLVLYQDRPSTPKLLVNQTNVVNGSFSFSGGSVKSVYNAVTVVYNNPAKFYRQDQINVDDANMIVQQGLKETSDIAFGCVSEAQAVRYGKWLIETERSDPLLLTYTAGWDHYNIRPGELVAVEDDIFSENAPSGRVRSASGTQVVVDRDVSGYLPGSKIHLTLANGQIFSSTISQVTNQNTVIIQNAIPSTVLVGAVYIINTDANAFWYLVTSKSETEFGTFDITAIRHFPDKYQRIDAEFKLGVGGTNIATTPISNQGQVWNEIDETWS